ncbi:hypothetical protein [Chryseobacterium sp. SIMBA_029]|uniref:hypothetical protein n=1 Tax=Chryseobacterium sp. SIMBA_029 TaxID=3085772 RepID=UPI003979E86E
MKDFLTTAGLYEKKVILEDYKVGNKKYYDEQEFEDTTFDYYCQEEEKTTTFQLGLNYATNSSFGSEIHDSYFKNDFLDFSFTAVCTCQSCKKEKVYFLLHVYSDKKLSQKIGTVTDEQFRQGYRYDEPNAKIYIEKAGIFPEVKIKVDKEINKFLDKENKTFYFKGLKALSNNLGVGALGYFRRIVESELMHIVREVKSLPNSDKGAIQKLLDEYEKSKKVSSIYENIYQFLPLSLQSINYNPLMLLYNLRTSQFHRRRIFRQSI